MVKEVLDVFFDDFLSRETLFMNKGVLQASYAPETLPHRDEQKKKVAGILAPSLNLDKPSNAFIYGKTGTGKTLVTKHVTNKLLEHSIKNSKPLKVIYLNCKLKKIADTEYRLIAQLAREFGKAIPATGLPTDEVYKTFYDALDNGPPLVILVLDEIDQLVKKTGDELLYNLTRINEELKKTKLSLIGISNDMRFVDELDPRVKSSLSEEEIIFPPYNAIQLQDILRQRAEQAFKCNAIEGGVIEKCAAYAAKEHGDARRALELLRIAGELAERSGCKKIQMQHIDGAEQKIDRDRFLDVVSTQPKQSQAILYSLLSISLSREGNIFTGEVYENYKRLCQKIGLGALTQRRVSGIISELDMLGLINMRVISKGRYGRTRELYLSIPTSINPKIKKILEDGLELS
jgi:cell division control protein 6